MPLEEYYVDSLEVIFGVNEVPDAGIRHPLTLLERFEDLIFAFLKK